MSLKEIARQTLSILEQGGFETEDGRRVDIADAQQAAVEGTFVCTPQMGEDFMAQPAHGGNPPRITVTADRTQQAARRLVEDEGQDDLAVLNFASARNPGGGFVRGAKAQEEDVARACGVYPCLLEARSYYEINRAQSSLLYTDHLIYSPRVPWFRVRSTTMLDRSFLASIITAPAPNAGEVLRREPDAGPKIEAAFRKRAGLVLALARSQGHRNLLLGAWGCGVFRNDPHMVADAFGLWLSSEHFAGDFDHVEFAVFDRTKGRLVYQAFADRFRSRPNIAR